MGVGVALGHAGVAVTEHDHLGESDHLGRAGQFDGSHLGQELTRRSLIETVEGLTGLGEGRVLQVALLTSRAAHEYGAHAPGSVHREGRRPLGGLVVGVGVHREDRGRDTVGHAREATGSLRGVRGRTRRCLSVTAVALLTVALVACDTGDGRELRDPTVPYVPPTEPEPTP